MRIRRTLLIPLTTVATTVTLLAGAPVATASGITYVGRVAAKSTGKASSVNLKTTAPVSAGSALIVAVMLNGAKTGTVAGSDSAGNTYTNDRDQSDTQGNRLIVLSAENVKALPSGGSIKLTIPQSANSYTTVDNFSGVGAVDAGSSAFGPAGTFDSGPVTASAGELLFGVAGLLTSAQPAWSSGWTPLTSLTAGSRQLQPAYQLAGSAGSYDASGTTAGAWLVAEVAYTVAPTPEAAPMAKLTVTPSSGTVPLSVTADASASTDVDSTPISSYTFDFGDGTVVGPQAGATAAHTYSSAGSFTVKVTVTDTAGLSSPATQTVSATSSSNGAQVAVYAGYYDTHHANTQPKPSPWMGSPNVVFEGTPDSSSGGWDTSGVRIDNLTATSLPFVSVTVDIGTHHFALWNTTSLAAGQTLIVAQTAYENFDGSDTNPAGCYGCDPTLCTTEVQSTVPVVHVTVDGVTTNYPDPNQVLSTRGVDAAGCPYTGTRNDESEAWQQLASGP
jgi:PKD repeat protein